MTDLLMYCRSSRLPSSTLFPYTTLFRSVTRPAGRRDGHVACVVDVVSELAKARYDVRRAKRRRPHVDAASSAAQIEGDRKSTRLNSSHPSISYAVFCLKKKIHPCTQSCR